ncbi:hypothetical protein NW768_002857 [Fusarium equiseti]|uniref:DUF7600 domain-containing protein n=1 Tax=Fusarium equiseti TaxID=61235 RepID=A0ABQ8RKJ9_FUSEQ|nr:hypothetical protein NW768_002857 [Fusarium equiseti]
MPAQYKTDHFQIPALRKAIAFSARLQQDAFHSKLDPQKLSLGKDIFSRLPTEMAETIVTLLPSPDNAFGPQDSVKEETLYLSLHVWASDNLGMSNRRRVWKLVDGIQSALCQIRDTVCFGTSFKSILEPEAPDDAPQVADGHSWSIAERNLEEPHLRNLRHRALCSPGPILVTQVSVSLFDTPDGPFVAGLSFVDHNGQVAHLGYCHPRNIVDIELPVAQRIQGWEVAHDALGVGAIAVVAQDGTVSSFAGNPDGIPRKLVVSSEGVSSIQASFDAVKLVALGQTTKDVITNRTGYFWHPEVPAKEFFLNGASGDSLPTSPNRLARTVFFEQPGDNKRLTSILCDNVDVCHIGQMEFSFMSAESVESWQKLGDASPVVTRQFDARFEDTGVQNYYIDLDGPNGEEITGLDVQMHEGLVCGLKVHTNFGRSKSLTSKSSPILGNPRFPWVSIRPQGSKIVGMYMIGGGFCECIFADIGLISV